MNANLKVVLASGLSFLLLVIPGLSDVVHEAGGSTAVVAAAVTLNVLVHALVHKYR